jgi:3-methyl-2-oxobutanoate hydroxymethyltransferase
MMGLFTDFRPKFVKRYADAGGLMRAAVEDYCREVRAGTFPGPEHGFR